MQTFLDHLQSAVGTNLGLKVGYFFVGALALQTVLMTYHTLRRLYFDRQQRRFSRERLHFLIKAAKAQCQEVEQTKLVWNGFRKFQVSKKIQECADVYSLYLTPHDGKPLPSFKPGQYLTFQLNIPGRAKPDIRCYSLSDSPHHRDYYRVTIKKVPVSSLEPPGPGISSSFFCERIKVGDILDVKAPLGKFVLNLEQDRPVVLISGGVGVTPMVSMANAIVANGSKREVWFFFGARDRAEHIFQEHLTKLAQDHENIRLRVCYSRPRNEDRLNHDYHHAERVSVDLFKRLLPSNNYDFFICGPGPMMTSITQGLEEWGVPKEHVFFEAFGPATVVKSAPAPALTDVSAAALQVTFSRSGKALTWKPEAGSLLDFANDNGLKIEAGCRAGNCGTCLVAIKSGAVDYLSEPGEAPEAGSCLTCICRPKTNLVLDA